MRVAPSAIPPQTPHSPPTILVFILERNANGSAVSAAKGRKAGPRVTIGRLSLHRSHTTAHAAAVRAALGSLALILALIDWVLGGGR